MSPKRKELIDQWRADHAAHRKRWRVLNTIALVVGAISTAVASFAIAPGAPPWALKVAAWIGFGSALLTNLRTVGGKHD